MSIMDLFVEEYQPNGTDREVVRLLKSRTLPGTTAKAAVAQYNSEAATLSPSDKSALIKKLRTMPMTATATKKAASEQDAFSKVPAGVYRHKGTDYAVTRPKGWSVGDDGWYFIKTADNKPVKSGTLRHEIMTAVAKKFA
jgi:hypothetical protein